MTPLHTLLGLIVVQRLAELWLARRNARRLLARGGHEVGAGHYPLLVLLHAGWLMALTLTVPAGAKPHVGLLAAFAVLMVLRAWVIWSLGPYWTTRIITVPTAPLVRCGPYCYLRHPNYLVVAGEIAVLPLAFGAWRIALVFSILNGALLVYRIGVENAALAQRTAIGPSCRR